jgi:hypothetical protein
MIQFDAAPPVPLEYPRLAALNQEEVEQARSAGYVAESVNPEEDVQRAGLNNCTEPRARDDIRDWRTRMYVIWFCYIYESFALIRQPLYAIEELILEFKAQDVLDTPNRRIATLYAGAGGSEQSHQIDYEEELERLKPHYIAAIALLELWDSGHH